MSTMKLRTFLFLAVLFGNLTVSNEIPEFIIGAANKVKATWNSGVEGIEAFLLKRLQFLPQIIKNGSPKFGIPVMDPLEVPSQTTPFKKKNVDLTVKIFDTKVVGLLGLQEQLPKVTLRPLGFVMILHAPRLGISGGYTKTGTALKKRINDKGEFDIVCSGVTVTATGAMSIRRVTSLQVDTLELQLTQDKFRLDFHHLYSNRNLQKVMEEAGQAVFEKVKKIVLEDLQEAFRAELNDKFSTLDIRAKLSRGQTPGSSGKKKEEEEEEDDEDDEDEDDEDEEEEEEKPKKSGKVTGKKSKD